MIQQGDEEADSKSASQAQRSLDTQVGDLRDARADAVANMEKAKALLDATTVKSSTDGTVVEVNKDVSKSTTGTNQTLVHIVSNGNLQVKGELSEYNLANISVGQEVTLTSKVYPGKNGLERLATLPIIRQKLVRLVQMPQVLDKEQGELNIRLR